MKRGAKEKRGRDRSRPVEHIEVSGKHAGLRLLAAALLLVVGCALLGSAFMQLTAPDTGWQTVEASSSAGLTCGEEFTFLYQSGSTMEAKKVSRLYTELCLQAFQLFESGQSFEGVVNICTLNQNPNQVLEVDGALYEALSLYAASGRREIYLGPVYSRYNDLFFCQHEAQLVDFDPRLNPDVREEYEEILAFANDSRAIHLEILGENRVSLRISQAYLDYAQEKGIETFIDFDWMRNAFVADFLASGLAAEGYTCGVLSSDNGFSRNLDERGTDYSYPLYHRGTDGIRRTAAVLHYQGPMSLVQMRDYPMNEADLLRYYELRTGEIRTTYLDAADALCKSSIDTLTCYSREKGCAEILLEMIPVYIAGEFREASIPELAAGGTQSVYCRDREVVHTDPGLTLGNLFQEEGVSYTTRQIVS